MYSPCWQLVQHAPPGAALVSSRSPVTTCQPTITLIMRSTCTVYDSTPELFHLLSHVLAIRPGPWYMQSSHAPFMHARCKSHRITHSAMQRVLMCDVRTCLRQFPGSFTVAGSQLDDPSVSFASIHHHASPPWSPPPACRMADGRSLRSVHVF
jgi:hypothetical protein